MHALGPAGRARCVKDRRKIVCLCRLWLRAEARGQCIHPRDDALIIRDQSLFPDEPGYAEIRISRKVIVVCRDKQILDPGSNHRSKPVVDLLSDQSRI